MLNMQNEYGGDSVGAPFLPGFLIFMNSVNIFITVFFFKRASLQTKERVNERLLQLFRTRR